MKRLLSALLFSIPLAGPVYADACDALINTAQSALASPNLPATQRSELEALINAGRAAKASGDIKSCEAAMTSTPGKLPQSRPSGRGDHECERSLNTV
jgi:hypothetical protein